MAIVGPTGCGKSTLLNVAAGLIAPSAGRVEIFGVPLAGLNRQAGYLFQAEALFPWKTALENVAIGLETAGVAARGSARAGASLARRASDSPGSATRYPHMLSGGQRKRVGLVQVLIRDPKILLMDEPFGPLDAQTRQIMGNLLLDLWSADRKAVLFVTHDLEEAIALSDRVVIMSAGPAARIIGDWRVALPRPRDIAEVKIERRLPRPASRDLGDAEDRGAQGLRADRRRLSGRLLGTVCTSLCAHRRPITCGETCMGPRVPVGGNSYRCEGLMLAGWRRAGSRWSGQKSRTRKLPSRSRRRRSRTARCWQVKNAGDNKQNPNCVGDNVSPPLVLDQCAGGNQELRPGHVDPEGRGGLGVNHWVAYGIPASRDRLRRRRGQQESDKYVGGKSTHRPVASISGPARRPDRDCITTPSP